MTSRGIGELEKRIIRNLPRILVEVFDVDPTRYLLSVLKIRLSSDRQHLAVALALRFLPGPKFCCRHPLCPVPTDDRELLAEVARRLAKRVGLPASMQLSVTEMSAIVEGAQFFTAAELKARTQEIDDRRVAEIVREYDDRRKHLERGLDSGASPKGVSGP